MAQTASNIPLWSGSNNLLTSGILMSELYVNKINNVDFGSATAPTSNQVLTAVSASNAQWITPTGTVSDAFTQTSVKTADYTANAGDEVLVDLSSASNHVTISMPASPVAGNQVRVVLISEHPTSNCKLSRNGNNWFGVTTTNIEDKYTLCLNGDNVTCRYFSSNVGWNVITDCLQPHFSTIKMNTNLTVATGSTTVLNLDTLFTSAFQYNIGNIANVSACNITSRRSGTYTCEVSIYSTNVPTGSTGFSLIYSGNGTPLTIAHETWYKGSAATTGNINGTNLQTIINLPAGSNCQFSLYSFLGANFTFTDSYMMVTENR
jgi:hypothetical protein